MSMKATGVAGGGELSPASPASPALRVASGADPLGAAARAGDDSRGGGVGDGIGREQQQDDLLDVDAAEGEDGQDEDDEGEDGSGEEENKDKDDGGDTRHAPRTPAKSGTHDVARVSLLMSRGAWLAAARLCEHLSYKTDADGPSPLPHDVLQLASARALCLARARQLRGAADALSAALPHDAQQQHLHRRRHRHQHQHHHQQQQHTHIVGMPEDRARYEFFPRLYPGMFGSMVPFTLRLLRALLRHLLHEDSALDALVALRTECRAAVAVLLEHEDMLRADAPAAPPTPAGALHPPPVPSNVPVRRDGAPPPPLTHPFDETLACWREREFQVSLALATRLVEENEHALATAILEECLAAVPAPAPARRRALLGALGRVHLLTGDVARTGVVLAALDDEGGGGGSSSSSSNSNISSSGSGGLPSPIQPSGSASAATRALSADVHLSRGLCSLSRDQWNVASTHFRRAQLAGTYGRVAGANNLAICQLCATDLQGAIGTVEDLLAAEPARALGEPAVPRNLCTLFDLESDAAHAAEKKRAVLALAAKHAPDSFDQSVLKLDG